MKKDFGHSGQNKHMQRTIDHKKGAVEPKSNNRQEGGVQALISQELRIFITWYDIYMASLASERALLLTFEQFIA